MKGHVAVVGGGSWGTALAIHLARTGSGTRMWIHDPDLERTVRGTRENATYLPGFRLPEGLDTTSDIDHAVEGASTVLVVVPSHHLRDVVRSCRPALTRAPSILIAAKGIENESLLRMSQVVAAETGLPPSRIAVLSGPSFAREVAAGHPTTVVVATRGRALAERLQARLSHGNLRIYRNADVVGVEMGGALKNVVALAAGMLEGLGYGSNTAAALLTRGLHEITRLAVALGARRATLAGLAGMGDLFLTATGSLSRNRQVGIELGRGRRLPEILEGMKMVAEGVRTSRSAAALARREGVEMPIVEHVNAILFQDLSPGDAVRRLLARELTDEMAL